MGKVGDTVTVAYWYEDRAKNNLQEYRGVGRIQILSGALVIHDADDNPSLIIAPGDWHEVSIEAEES